MQFSSLERNYGRHLESENKSTLKDVALVYLLSSLLIFLVVLSIFVFFLRLFECLFPPRGKECSDYRIYLIVWRVRSDYLSTILLFGRIPLKYVVAKSVNNDNFND